MTDTTLNDTLHALELIAKVAHGIAISHTESDAAWADRLTRSETLRGQEQESSAQVIVAATQRCDKLASELLGLRQHYEDAMTAELAKHSNLIEKVISDLGKVAANANSSDVATATQLAIDAIREVFPSKCNIRDRALEALAHISKESPT